MLVHTAVPGTTGQIHTHTATVTIPLTDPYSLSRTLVGAWGVSIGLSCDSW